ncbi:MAG: hypothetical protein LUC34_06135 [Campylobacter sp.]|nr:hypothetical protein [Campylobacter sp.]
MYGRKIFITFILFFTFYAQNLFAQNNEDLNLRLLQALMQQNNSDISGAIATYRQIFAQTQQTAYLKEAIKLAFVSVDSSLGELMEEGEKFFKDDSEFIRMKVAILVNKNQLSNAREMMRELVKKEPNAQNILILGTICMMQNESLTALKYFEEAYALSGSEENLLRVADVLLNRFDNLKETVRYLEDFRNKSGCTVKTCELLADIYSQSVNFPKVVELYEELYELTRDNVYLDKTLQIFIYDKNYKAAAEFLKKHSYNDAMLMEIYAAIGNFGDAYVLAAKLYNDSRDLNFLAKMAMYEYEMNSKNINKERLDSIVDKFEASALKLDNEIFLNYYGYLLIDHDIDVKKGIKLVKRALELSPDSPYYQDSLAWGYFKLGECDKAKEYMLLAMKDVDFKNSTEAKEHLHLIERCIVNLNKELKK